jgi:hypothetical protein
MMIRHTVSRSTLWASKVRHRHRAPTMATRPTDLLLTDIPSTDIQAAHSQAIDTQAIPDTLLAPVPPPMDTQSMDTKATQDTPLSPLSRAMDQTPLYSPASGSGSYLSP